MPKASDKENDYWVPLLELGPFGGLDTTTEPYWVATSNFVAGQNFVPNRGYGGFNTVQGRLPFLAAPLPGQCTGMFQCDRNGEPSLWFFAVTVAGVGQLYYAEAGGTAVQLATPVPLTPSLQTSFTSSLQWVFLTNGVDVPIKVHVSDLIVTYWGIVAPAAAPTGIAGGTSTMTGTYNYSITFGNPSQESSQGVISADIMVTDTGVALVSIPTSADPQVTQRNIYRIGGSLGEWRLVATLHDNTTTTYLDTTADADLNGQLLVIYRDPPAPFVSICSHMERIWGFGTPEDGSVVWFSNYNEPWGFNSDTGTRPVGENSFNDRAVGLASIGGSLVLLKAKTTYAVFGNSDSTFITNKLFDIGCKSLRSIFASFGVVWWLSNQGVYLYDGSSPQNLSDGGYQKSNIKASLASLTEDDLAIATSFIYQRMFHMSFPSINTTWLYDLRSAQWFQLSFALDQVACTQESVSYPVVGTNLESVGQIDNWFATGGDLGEPLYSTLTSKIEDSGDVTISKSYRYVIVEAPNSDAEVYVQTVVNPGTLNYMDTQSIDLSVNGPRFQLSLPMTMDGTQVQLQIKVRSSENVRIQKLAVYGAELARFREND